MAGGGVVVGTRLRIERGKDGPQRGVVFCLSKASALVCFDEFVWGTYECDVLADNAILLDGIFAEAED
eukprot:20801-Pleurochrysis_carterae.AAC.1